MSWLSPCFLKTSFSQTLQGERGLVNIAISQASSGKCSMFEQTVSLIQNDVFKDALYWSEGLNVKKCTTILKMLEIAECTSASGLMTEEILSDFIVLLRSRASQFDNSEKAAAFLFLEEIMDVHWSILSLSSKIAIVDIMVSMRVKRELIANYVNKIWSVEIFEKKQWLAFFNKYSSMITEESLVRNVQNAVLLGNLDIAKKGVEFIKTEKHRNKINYGILFHEECDEPMFLDIFEMSKHNPFMGLVGIRSCSALSYDQKVDMLGKIKTIFPLHAKIMYDYTLLFLREGGFLMRSKNSALGAKFLLNIKGLVGKDLVSHAISTGFFAVKSGPKEMKLSIELLQNALKIADAQSDIATINYLLGRIYSKMGSGNLARSAYVSGAKNPFLFYGQLCLEELGVNPVVVVARKMNDLNLKSQHCQVMPTDMLLELGNIYISRGDKWRALRYFESGILLFSKKSSDPCYFRNVINSAKGHFGYYLGKVAANGNIPVQSMSYPVMPKTKWPPVVNAIIRNESNFNSSLVSSRGALGFMQVMERTGMLVAKNAGVDFDRDAALKDPDYNVSIGHMFFLEMKGKYKNIAVSLAAYNAGMGNVEKWILLNGNPTGGIYETIDWIESVPFKETRDYIKLVIQAKVVYDAIQS